MSRGDEKKREENKSVVAEAERLKSEEVERRKVGGEDGLS